MLEIIRYYNTKNETIKVMYDEELERVVIWNVDNDNFKAIKELKNIFLDMWEYVLNDFSDIINYNDEFTSFEDDDLEYLEESCKYYNEFINQL